MEVIAFVGGSGTGKSHRALVLAHENSVECIIDDGILIHEMWQPLKKLKKHSMLV